MEERQGQTRKKDEGWPIKWKRKNPRTKSQKLASLAFEICFQGFFLFHFIGHLSLPFWGWVAPLLLVSSFPSLLFNSFSHDLQPLLYRPCTWHMMWNDSWEVLPSPPLYSTPVKCSSGLKICAEGVGSGVIRATSIWTEAIPYNHCTEVERGHSLKLTFK